MPFFCVTMLDVSQDDAFWVQKSVLGETEGNIMFSLVFNIFAVIPIKPGTLHGLQGNTLREFWQYHCMAIIMVHIYPPTYA
jgi:hypothetical protein